MPNHKVVIGLGFGDEGKGVLTDYLCSKTEARDRAVVTRFSGGHQVGHTVEYNNIRHVFSNFGSGSLRGIPTVWSKFCTVDPVGICRELKVLRSKGIEPKLYIDPLCPITTPYDKFANMNSKETLSHGSCGVGYGKTIEREERLYSLLAGDLQFSQVFSHKLALIAEYYKEELARYECEFLDACEELLSTKTNIEIREWPASTIIFEGNQGLLLDKNIGFFPHVTRGNTDLTNLYKLGVENPQVYFVTRCYQTRHGNGPMTNVGKPHNIIRDPNETNVTHKYQGEFRISMLDLDLIEYAMSRCEIRGHFPRQTLAITCIEHLNGPFMFTYKDEVYEMENTIKFRAFLLNTFPKIDNIWFFKNHQRYQE